MSERLGWFGDMSWALTVAMERSTLSASLQGPVSAPEKSTELEELGLDTDFVIKYALDSCRTCFFFDLRLPHLVMWGVHLRDFEPTELGLGASSSIDRGQALAVGITSRPAHGRDPASRCQLMWRQYWPECHTSALDRVSQLSVANCEA